MVIALQWVAIISLTFLVFLACTKIERLQDDIRARDRVDHSACLDAISRYLADSNEAAILRKYAEKYEDPLEQSVLNRLAREVYRSGGPNMPTIWLNYYADKIDPNTTEKEK